jgi:hypothetical protein
MQELNEQVVKCSKPPAWLNRAGYWFRIGLTIFIGLAMLLGTAACSASSDTTFSQLSWEKASGIVPPETLIEIVQSHSSIVESKEAIAIMRVEQVRGKKGQLNLYDFNNSKLCGKMGCLYVGYLIPNDKSQAQREVFTAYLNPNIAPKTALFEVETGEQGDVELPCLLVNKLVQKSQRRLKFCYDGLVYQLT